MKISYIINKLRNEAKLTQAQFSEIVGVSQQSVQKWESGISVPDLEKLILISKYFDVSLDALILGNDNRVVEEMNKTKTIKPQYQNIHDNEFYSSSLSIEYQQSIEEGLDIERYQDIFSSVSRLPLCTNNSFVLTSNEFGIFPCFAIPKIDGLLSFAIKG